MRSPYPDVLRLLASARSDGPYDRLDAARRSPLERYGYLWRALEQIRLARPGETVDATLSLGLTEPVAPGLEGALRSLAANLARLQNLSDARMRDLLDPRREKNNDLGGFRRHLQIAKQVGGKRTLDARDRTALAIVLRELRNAVAHAGALTTDRDVTPVYGVASALLDQILVALYAKTFDMSGAEVESLVGQEGK